MPFCKYCGTPHAECFCWVEKEKPIKPRDYSLNENELKLKIAELMVQRANLEKIIEWAANELGGYERSDAHHLWIARELLKKIKRNKK